MQNGFKQRFLLLGAYGSNKDDSDWCKVRLAAKSDFGGWDVSEFYYGKSSDIKGINALVEAGPVPADCELSPAKDFKTGGMKLVLKNLSVVKG